ncbi:MAG TPA: acetate--CoA ligase family protein, partial [Acidimicrobiales bacterium]|nr:acetate--CoA ligase family protein [Acidimicrobiales bacterium]
DLVSIAHRHGMRILGPASMGIISTVPKVSMQATYAPVTLIPGRVAFSSTSGPLGVALLEQAHRAGVGISHFVALGNKADVSTNDFLQYWEGDDATSVMALHIGSFGNPRKFTRIARRVSKAKPIVAVKTGGGDEDRTVDALFRQTGVIPVAEIAQLFDVARVLDSQPLPGGERVVVLSNAHGAHALAQAALAGAGLRLAELSADTRGHLAAILPNGATVANPVDLTFGAEPADYDGALRSVLADGGVDAAIVIFASALPERHGDVADVIVAAHVAHPTKPVLASVLGVEDRGLRDDAGHVVPAFAFPETAVATLGRVAEHARWKRRPEGITPDPVGLGIDLERAEALVAHALDVRPSGTLLPWSVAAELLGLFGIGVAPAVAVASLHDALAAAGRLGYPVALKATGMTRVGRSEEAGVALDLHDDDAVRGAYRRMSDGLGIGMNEALVQTMIRPGLETAVGIHHDPTFGPVVTFGLGGAFASAIADTATRVTPLTESDAADLVRSARAWGVLEGGDYAVDAVEDLLLRVGMLADLMPEIAQLTMNPVLISATSATAVDLSLRVAPPPPDPNPAARRMLRMAPAEAPEPARR